jgi:glycerol uptake facilitator-like aquaporin
VDSTVPIRRLAAECLGTAFLLATIVGSGIMGERLSGSNEALALLCNSLATGAILIVLISVFGQVSGAHLNPAVTLAFMVRREIGPTMAVAYMGSQLVGAVAGTLAAHVMFEQSVLQLATQHRSGAGLWFSEALATFGLVLAIMGTLRWKSEMVPISVGLYIGSAYWFTASTSFANPAVTVARSITDTFAGIHPADVLSFIVFQTLGALLAALLCGVLFDRPTPMPVKEPRTADGLNAGS